MLATVNKEAVTKKKVTDLEKILAAKIDEIITNHFKSQSKQHKKLGERKVTIKLEMTLTEVEEEKDALVLSYPSSLLDDTNLRDKIRRNNDFVVAVKPSDTLLSKMSVKVNIKIN